VLRAINPADRHLFWLFENVSSMQAETRDTISRFFECEPTMWDAKHFTAMRRPRLFWGNLPGMHCPLPYCGRNLVGCIALSDTLFPTRTARVSCISLIA